MAIKHATLLTQLEHNSHAHYELRTCHLQYVTKETVQEAGIPPIGHTSVEDNLWAKYLVKALQVSNILESS